MKLRMYNMLVVNKTESGERLTLDNAPVDIGVSLPEEGFCCYYNQGSSMMQVLSRRGIVSSGSHSTLIVDIHVDGFERAHGELATTNTFMRPQDVASNEVLILNTISAPLRAEIVQVLSDHATEQEQRVTLDAITADRHLADYIKRNPTAVDVLHRSERFKHMRAIVFPSGLPEHTNMMVALYKTSPEMVTLKALGSPAGNEIALPEFVFH